MVSTVFGLKELQVDNDRLWMIQVEQKRRQGGKRKGVKRFPVGWLVDDSIYHI